MVQQRYRTGGAERQAVPDQRDERLAPLWLGNHEADRPSDARGVRFDRPWRGQLPRPDPGDGVPERGRACQGLRRRRVLGHPRRAERARRETGAAADIGDGDVPDVPPLDPEPCRPAVEGVPDRPRLTLRDEDDTDLHARPGDPLIRGSYGTRVVSG